MLLLVFFLLSLLLLFFGIEQYPVDTFFCYNDHEISLITLLSVCFCFVFVLLTTLRNVHENNSHNLLSLFVCFIIITAAGQIILFTLIYVIY